MVMGQSDRILINYFEGSGKAAVYGVCVLGGDDCAAGDFLLSTALSIPGFIRN